MTNKYDGVTHIRLTHPMSNGGTMTFKARIVKRDADGSVWVEIPKRVRTMPFPPVGGKRYAKFTVTLSCAKCGRPQHEHIYGDGGTFVGVHGCEFVAKAR